MRAIPPVPRLFLTLAPLTMAVASCDSGGGNEPPPGGEATLEIQSLTQNGQPIDPANVAGEITANLAIEVPAGFTGTLTITIGDVEFHRENLTASAPALAAGAEQFITVTKGVSIVTTDYTVTQTNLSDLQVLRTNGTYDFKALINGTAGGRAINVGQTRQITLQNPNSFLATIELDNTPVSGAGGQQWFGGGSTVNMGQLNFELKDIEQIQVTKGPSTSIYGGDPTSGIVNTITKSSPNALSGGFNFTKSLLPGQSPAAGNRYFVDSYSFPGGPIFNPQVNRYHLNGNGSDWDGDGAADATPPTTLPAGWNRWVKIPSLDTKLSYTAQRLRFDATVRYDNQEPDLTGDFTLAEPDLTGFNPFGKRCCANNYVGGFNVSDITIKPTLGDAGSGLGTTKYYYGLDAAQLFSPGNEITSFVNVPSTSTPGYLGAGFCDLTLNCRLEYTRPSPRNQLNDAGRLLVKVDRDPPSLQFSEPRKNRRALTLSGSYFRVQAQATDAGSGLPANPVGYSVRGLDGTCFFGEGTGCAPKFDRTNGASVDIGCQSGGFDATLTGTPWARVNVQAFDNAGNESLFGDTNWLKFGCDLDIPQLLNTTYNPATYTVSSQVQDNWHINSHNARVIFGTFPNAGFDGGFVYVPLPLDLQRGGGFKESLVPDLTTLYQLPPLLSLQLHSQTGPVGPSYTPTALRVEATDGFGNWALSGSFSYAGGNAGAIDPPLGMSLPPSGTVCLGIADCGPATQSSYSLDVTTTEQDGTLFDYAMLVGITQEGRSIPLCYDTTPERVGNAWQFTCNVNWGDSGLLADIGAYTRTANEITLATAWLVAREQRVAGAFAGYRVGKNSSFGGIGAKLGAQLKAFYDLLD